MLFIEVILQWQVVCYIFDEIRKLQPEENGEELHESNRAAMGDFPLFHTGLPYRLLHRHRYPRETVHMKLGDSCKQKRFSNNQTNFELKQYHKQRSKDLRNILSISIVDQELV